MSPLLDSFLTATVASFAALVIFSILPAPKRKVTRDEQQAIDEWNWYLRSKGR